MRRFVGTLLGAALAGGVLFALSGTLEWWNAWLFLMGMVALGLMSSRAIDRSPGLAQERRTAAAGAPTWDRRVVRLTNLALPLMLLVASLELRVRGSSAVPTLASAAAFAFLIPASVLTYRSMAANPFFSSHVRIQTDRSHSVVSTGPYRFVRHPGYAGAVAFNLLTPLALGSWLALLPALMAAGLLVWRTAREDGMLTGELAGYAEYKTRVRYRFFPGIW